MDVTLKWSLLNDIQLISYMDLVSSTHVIIPGKYTYGLSNYPLYVYIPLKMLGGSSEIL